MVCVLRVNTLLLEAPPDVPCVILEVTRTDPDRRVVRSVLQARLLIRRVVTVRRSVTTQPPLVIEELIMQSLVRHPVLTVQREVTKTRLDRNNVLAAKQTPTRYRG